MLPPGSCTAETKALLYLLALADFVAAERVLMGKGRGGEREGREREQQEGGKGCGKREMWDGGRKDAVSEVKRREEVGIW